MTPEDAALPLMCPAGLRPTKVGNGMELRSTIFMPNPLMFSALMPFMLKVRAFMQAAAAAAAVALGEKS